MTALGTDIAHCQGHQQLRIGRRRRDVSDAVRSLCIREVRLYRYVTTRMERGDLFLKWYLVKSSSLLNWLRHQHFIWSKYSVLEAIHLLSI